MTPRFGIFLKLASVAFFVSMQAMIKAVSDHIPPGEAVFFRSFFALPIILTWLMWQGRLAVALKTDHLRGNLMRGLFGVCGMGLSFAAVGYLPLPEVTAIFFASPILTTIFAAMFLGERVRMIRIAAVGLGLFGVLIILWPRLTGFGHIAGTEANLMAFGAMLAFVAACFVSVAKILVRRLVGKDHPSTVVLYAGLCATGAGLLTAPFGWVWPTPLEWALLLTAGLVGGIGQALLTTAYKYADASTIAPFDYSSMLFAIAFGYFIFADLPTLQTLIGAAIVISAGGIILWREGRLRLERAAARQITPSGG
ncbi:DMT family transporter [Aliiroseovarius lamellibrachiae]|uniref:DMT family transporter n=1 Tax=Aliiroseovarius lamellibrachiae TaxID=1924933 RepID=UPI001BE05609|nr:DMT family transporter [Aliiroseovarius lamellibrachiae]MBT2131071.1 DMT family transporter [Aliiroseovarius lamellibrachiae]